MFHVILYQPEIPPNTGNVIRLCANAGATLHLVKPLGFQITDRAIARAGLDYRELAEVAVHNDWDACRRALAGHRILAATTRGQVRYDQFCYATGDALLFGSETKGLPETVLDRVAASNRVCLPMRPASRCLNLSNSVAIVLYEAWRQQGFAGSTRRAHSNPCRDSESE